MVGGERGAEEEAGIQGRARDPCRLEPLGEPALGLPPRGRGGKGKSAAAGQMMP